MECCIFILLLAGLVGKSATTTDTTTAKTSSPPVIATSTSPVITTTGAPAITTTAAPPPKPKVQMEFKMSKQFTSELEDQNSAAFTELANEVTSKLNEVYSKKFGDGFKETVIKKFSQGSVVADVELIFNEGNSVPDASSVADTLVAAASDKNFDLGVDTSSISAKVVLPPTQAPTTVAPSTPTSESPSTANTNSPPITMTSPPLSATSPPITMTSPPLSATSPPVTTMPLTGASTATTSTVTTTASTNPPSSSEGTLGLQFSLNKIFTADLSNPSSTAFQTLAASVVAEVNKVNKRLYGSLFDRSIVNSFREGSVVVDMTLVYKDKSSVPSASSATSAFSTELTSNSTSLNIIPGSVSAQSTTTSSSPPRPTMVAMTVLSLTLLAVAQMLVDL